MSDLLLELSLFAILSILMYPCVPRSCRVNLLLIVSGAMILRVDPHIFSLALALALFGWLWLKAIEAGRPRMPRWCALGVPVASGFALLAWLDHLAPVRPSVVDWYGSRAVDEYATQIVPWFAIGASFYTLQFVECAAAVTRRAMPAPSLRDLALLLYFFPKFFAGPIVDSSRFVGQLQLLPTWSLGLFRVALLRVTCGVFLKFVIADRVGAYCDAVFASPGRFGALATALSFPLFAVQFVFELMAYLAVARGAAGLVGIELAPRRAVPWSAADARLQAHFDLGVAGTLSSLVRAVTLPRSVAVIGIFVAVGLWHRIRPEFMALGIYFAAIYLFWAWIDRLALPLRIAASAAIVAPSVCIGLVGIRLESLSRAINLACASASGTLEWVRRSGPDAGDFPSAFRLDALLVPLACAAAVGAIRFGLRGRSFLGAITEHRQSARWFVYLALVLGVLSFGRLSHQTLLYLRF